VRLALALAVGGLMLNVWNLWRPAPRAVHAKPRCLLKAPVARYNGDAHGHHVR
jgi:hypothetical protein